MKTTEDAVYSYEEAFRPNFELKSAFVAGVSAAASLAVSEMVTMPPEPFYAMSGLAVALACIRLPGAYRVHAAHQALKPVPISFIELKKLIRKRKRRSTDTFIGNGFSWGQPQAQLAFEMSKNGLHQESILDAVKNNPDYMGTPWIHGLGSRRERPIHSTDKLDNLHTMVAGATGTGKTRYLDLVISQRIAMKDATGQPYCVIVIDPKHDHDLKLHMRETCESLGMLDRYHEFTPSHPDRSIRLNPLATYTTVAEVASRLAALIPSENNGADAFTAFSWRALHVIAHALIICEKQPTLVRLKGYLERGPGPLIEQTIRTVLGESHTERLDIQLAKLGDKGTVDARAATCVRYFNEAASKDDTLVTPEVSEIIQFFESSREWVGKMIASLLPILSQLTAGEMQELLSPSDSLNDDRPVLTLNQIIKNRGVLYIGLNSLADTFTSSSLGSLLLAELANVASRAYNYSEGDMTPVQLFVDEASQVANQQLLQLLNQGRGAGFRVTFATQALSDLTSRLGSKDKTLQYLANVNSVIAFRSNDPATQEYLSELNPKTRVKYLMITQGSSITNGNDITHFTGNNGERLMEEEVRMIEPELFGLLPNLEYFARLPGGRLVKGRVPILTKKVEA